MKRKFETKDIVKRLGYLIPSNIKLSNYPLKIISAFNPACLFNEKENELIIFPRICIGYYSYSCAIAKFSLSYPLEKEIEKKEITAKLVIFPSNEYDFWGCEDPRVYVLNGKYMITYTGRSITYREEDINPFPRAVAITCVSEDLENFEPRWVFLPDFKIESIKNAFLFKTKNNLWYFYRLYFENLYSLRISKIENLLEKNGINKITLPEGKEIISPEPWERKIGWCTPPIKIENNKFLVFLHSVDKKLKVYRVFAAILDEEVNVVEITKRFIMEPRTIYEKFGDRPYVVFPCGAVKIDDKILISYGAADSFIGFGEVKIDEILSEMIPVE